LKQNDGLSFKRVIWLSSYVNKTSPSIPASSSQMMFRPAAQKETAYQHASAPAQTSSPLSRALQEKRSETLSHQERW
jgi:hypothetical protein